MILNASRARRADLCAGVHRTVLSVLPNGTGRAVRVGSRMNKDQLKGAANRLAGRIQAAAGELVGSAEQVVRGLTRQVRGKAQKGRGDVTRIIKDFKRDHPAE